MSVWLCSATEYRRMHVMGLSTLFAGSVQVREAGDRCRRFAELCRGVQTVHEMHGLLHVCTTMFVPLPFFLPYILIASQQTNSMNSRGP